MSMASTQCPSMSGVLEAWNWLTISMCKLLIWDCCCAEAKAKVLLLTALDEIAWLFNLRGSDVSYNPVFLSYATVSEDGAKLFVDEGKVQNHFHKHHTRFKVFALSNKVGWYQEDDED